MSCHTAPSSAALRSAREGQPRAARLGVLVPREAPACVPCSGGGSGDGEDFMCLGIQPEVSTLAQARPSHLLTSTTVIPPRPPDVSLPARPSEPTTALLIIRARHVWRPATELAGQLACGGPVHGPSASATQSIEGVGRNAERDRYIILRTWHEMKLRHVCCRPVVLTTSPG